MIRIPNFVAACCLTLVASAGQLSAQEYSFSVKHPHLLGGCTGKLTVHTEGIEYVTEESKHARKWSYLDLKRIEISSRHELTLYTYRDSKYRLGADEKFKFKLQDGEVRAEIYHFLLSRALRPLVTRVPFPSGSDSSAFSLQVKHVHVLGGCEGALKVGEDQIIYETSHPKDSRVWFYRDIESIGLMNEFAFRLTTILKTYTFDLKERMTSAQYDFIWARVYQLKNPYSEPASPVLGNTAGTGPAPIASRQNASKMQEEVGGPVRAPRSSGKEMNK